MVLLQIVTCCEGYSVMALFAADRVKPCQLFKSISALIKMISGLNFCLKSL